MAKDVCIKSGSYCPVCRGIIGTDCWHEARQFHAGSDYLDKLLKAQDRIKELEAAQILVTDAMVSRALDAVWVAPHGVETQSLMRLALVAAFTKE